MSTIFNHFQDLTLTEDQHNALEKIEKSPIEELIVTDSVPHSNINSKKIHVLSCAKLFADVMHSVHEHASISNKFLI